MSSSTDDSAATSPTAKVGYVRRAHGIKGAVVIRVLDEEVDRIVPGAVLMTDHGAHPSVTIESAQTHNDGLLVGLAGVDDRTTAEQLRGTSLLVSERRTLDDDEFWPEQLIGLSVVDTSGEAIGVISDVVPGPAQDRVVITVAEREVEVPFVAALFVAVDLPSGRLVLDAPEGLFEV